MDSKPPPPLSATRERPPLTSHFPALSCVGCICGPQIFLASESPLYPTAMGTIIGMYCAYLISMLAYRELCRRENCRRDRLAAEGVEAAQPKLAAKEDNTSDIDDLAFRYVL